MLRRTIRWPLVITGAVSFVGAHFSEIVVWRPLFDPAGQYRPWFLNSGLAVAFMAVWLLVTGALAEAAAPGAAPDHPALARGWSAALGAALAMAAVLFVNGPGTLFPIVLLLGSVVVVGSVLAGALAGAQLRRSG